MKLETSKGKHSEVRAEKGHRDPVVRHWDVMLLQWGASGILRWIETGNGIPGLERTLWCGKWLAHLRRTWKGVYSYNKIKSFQASAFLGAELSPLTLTSLSLRCCCYCFFFRLFLSELVSILICLEYISFISLLLSSSSLTFPPFLYVTSLTFFSPTPIVSLTPRPLHIIFYSILVLCDLIHHSCFSLASNSC